jgi:hypothetical protein
MQRLSQLCKQVKGGTEAWLRQAWQGREIEDVAASVQSRVDFWDSGDCSDEDLRLIAWIYLREAFALPERLCLSERGAARICDDLAAAAIAVGAPLSATPAATPDDQGAVNLARVVQPVLQELLATALGEGPGPSMPLHRNVWWKKRARGWTAWTQPIASACSRPPRCRISMTRPCARSC